MKKMTLVVPQYKEGVFSFNWEENHKICTKYDGKNHEFLIVGNKEGLISLANHLLNLSQNDVPNHEHIHLDVYNGGLEDQSVALVIEKNNNLGLQK